MSTHLKAQITGDSAVLATPIPIVALDVANAEDAFALVERLPEADFFKVGMQLFTAAGPDFVRRLKDRGCHIFLDLKFHDIPNTVAGAVRAAAALGVQILTVHAAGGATMLRAAADAAADAPSQPRVFAVTVLTSLGPAELADTWGRPEADTRTEAVRLAESARTAGVYGVVASVHEVQAIRFATRADFPVLTPGIRLPGDDAGDQARIASPQEAARLGVDFIVVGRSVTSAADPRAAFHRVLLDLNDASRETSS
jgi:orotidine-5'-phosphate decarboxylase